MKSTEVVCRVRSSEATAGMRIVQPHDLRIEGRSPVDRSDKEPAAPGSITLGIGSVRYSTRVGRNEERGNHALRDVVTQLQIQIGGLGGQRATRRKAQQVVTRNEAHGATLAKADRGTGQDEDG